MRPALLAVMVLLAAFPAHAAEPGATIVVVLTSAEDAARSHTVTVEPESGQSASRVVTVPARGRAEAAFPLEPGVVRVEVTYVEAPEVELSIIESYDARGCEGRFVAPFTMIPQGAYVDAGLAGCADPTRAMLALAEEARGVSPGGSARVAVPWPGADDAGRYVGAHGLVPPDWSNERALRNMTFRWARDGAATDASGREVHAAVLEWTGEPPLVARYASAVSVGDATFEEDDAAVLRDVTEVIAFEPGGVGALGHSLHSASGAGGFAGSAVALRRAFHYGAPEGDVSCLFRFPLQGQTVRAGDVLPASDVCAPWAGAGWRAGDVEERGELRVVPLYAFDASDGLRVAKVVLAEGVAYPVEVETYALPADGLVRHEAWRLAGHAPAGPPLDIGTATEGEPATLAPLDALRGPALGAARARFALPLDEASDAARADPSLRDLHALLARGDAALAGAEMSLRRDASTGASMHAWRLLFTTPSGPRVVVVCERGATALLASPLVRCASEPAPPPSLVLAPAVGKGDLPETAGTFDVLLALWSRVDPEGAAAPIARASWSAWDGRLRVGSGGEAALGAPSSGTSRTSSAALDAWSGRLASTATGVQRVSGPIPGPDGFASSAPLVTERAAAPFEVPRGVAVGAVAAGGILALALAWLARGALVGLFARLTGRAVLDSGTRQRILDVVRDEPGIHAAGVMERVGKRGGVTEHHLDVLVREGFLTCIESPGFRRFFVTGRFSHTEMRALSALREGQNEKVFRIIQANPGIHLTDLAERAGISLPYASKTVRSLQDAGLVDRAQAGRSVSFHALER